MNKPKVARAGAGRRKHRRRPTPKWLEASADLNAIARSRCLLVLSVLSGEKPVSDAIAEAKISRGTYYQLETRALRAMLAALNPLAATQADGSAQLSPAATARLAELQRKVERLEAEKRRADRLLYVTRKAMRLPPIKPPRRGRPPKGTLPSLISRRAARSRRLKEKAAPGMSSTPTPAGEGAP